MMVTITSPKHPQGRLYEFWDVDDLITYVCDKLSLVEGEPSRTQLEKSATEAASFFNGFFAFEGMSFAFEVETLSDVVVTSYS